MALSAILKQKPLKLLLALKSTEKQHYVSELAKSSGMSYAHALAVLKKLSDEGLVSLEKKGRLKVVSLTEKGAEIAALLYEINSKLKQREELPSS